MANVPANRRASQAAPAPVDPVAAIFDALAAPFPPEDVQERTGRDGAVLYYLEGPTVRRRLNEVVGRWNWECDVTPYEGGVKCSLILHLPGDLTLRRAALGGYADMPGSSPEDRFKSGDTDAFKRAACLFGIGEYLRTLRPEPAPTPAPRSAPAPTRDRERGAYQDLPTTGRALYSWAADRRLVETLAEIGAQHDFPARITNWSPEQVKVALRELP